MARKNLQVYDFRGPSADGQYALIAEVEQQGENLIAAVEKSVSETEIVYRQNGAGAISITTTLLNDSGGRKTRLKKLEVTWSSTPTTSESLTITRIASHNDDPDTVVFSHDPSLDSSTSLVVDWESGGVDVPVEDELTLAYTNTDTNTVKAKMTFEVV